MGLFTNTTTVTKDNATDFVCSIYNQVSADIINKNIINFYPQINIKNDNAIISDQGCLEYAQKYYLKEASCGMHKEETKVIVRRRSAKDLILKIPKIDVDNNLIDVSGAFSCPKVGPVASDACQDKNFCVHSNMPILSQSSPGLAKEISRLKNDSSIKADTGWCAAVATTMSYAAHQGNSNIQNLLYSNLPGLLSVPQMTDLEARTVAYSQHIFDVGQSIGTLWKQGGTWTSQMESGNQKRFLDMDVGMVDGRVSRVILNQKMKDSDSGKLKFQDNNLYIDLFKVEKPSMVIGAVQMSATYKADGTIDTSKYTGADNIIENYLAKNGHALAVNGIEEGHIKIFDPWGRIYNIDIKESGIIKGRQVVQPSGADAYGYFSNETNYNKKHQYNLITNITGLGARVIQEQPPVPQSCLLMVGGNYKYDDKSSCHGSEAIKNYLRVAFCHSKAQLNWTSRIYYTEGAVRKDPKTFNFDGGVKKDFSKLSDMCADFGLEYLGK